MTAPGPEYVLRFGRTMVELWRGCTRTVLPDGVVLPAAPEDTDAYRATAERLGYGEDVQAMSRDHEAVHSALAHWLGLPESPALGRVARGQAAKDIDWLEEDAVCAIQRYAKAAGVDLIHLWSQPIRLPRDHQILAEKGTDAAEYG